MYVYPLLFDARKCLSGGGAAEVWNEGSKAKGDMPPLEFYEKKIIFVNIKKKTLIFLICPLRPKGGGEALAVIYVKNVSFFWAAFLRWIVL